MVNGYSSRKRGNRKEYRTLVIVCEGKKTERNYFNRYRERKSGLLILTPNSSVTDPENLVDFALSQIKKYDINLNKGDEVWCVFDADRHTDKNIKKAKDLAGDKIKLCLSNPCFELWYLLHFYYFGNRVSTSEVQNKLANYIKNFDKAKDYFDLFLPKRDKAIQNAKKLNQKHKTARIELLSTQSNPSTQVFQLVEYILDTIQKNKR